MVRVPVRVRFSVRLVLPWSERVRVSVRVRVRVRLVLPW